MPPRPTRGTLRKTARGGDMHRFWIVAAAVALASPAWAQERMVGDFRVSEQPNAATKTTDYVASYEQRDIAFALRCKEGRQDMVLQFPGAQGRIGRAASTRATQAWTAGYSARSKPPSGATRV